MVVSLSLSFVQHRFRYPVTSASCGPSENLLAVGFETGAVGLVDLRVPSDTRLVMCERLHENPVLAVSALMRAARIFVALLEYCAKLTICVPYSHPYCASVFERY